VSLVWLPLAIQRETIMIVALVALSVAGVVFAAGAIAMFVRERRILRADPLEDPADRSEKAAGP
jgi:hypothetical protein